MKKGLFTKILTLALLVAVTATASVAGTLAYLTDRDSKANVFTIGDVSIRLDEDFNQGAELIPGVTIDKKPTIINTGSNDAWVWLEFAIPTALDNWALDTEEGSNNNVIHWNQLGATTEGYVTEERVAKAITDGHLAEGTTVDSITSENATWNLGGKTEFSSQKEIEGVKYNVYVLGYNKMLKPGEETLVNIFKVFLDERVDIDPDGNWHFVENGNVTALGWNSKENGNPIIYVSAYAMQTEGFASVDEAIRAYNAQWGNHGTQYQDTWDGTTDTSWYNDSEPEFVLTTSEQLAGLAELVDDGNSFEGKTIRLGNSLDLYALDENGEPICFDPIGSYRNDIAFKGTFDGAGNSISNLNQNTWALDNGYYYGDLGLGLFGKVEDATIKNLHMDNASISGESAICGTVAATAYGECTFENITVTNSQVNDYQYYAGGVVGWASGNHTYDNIHVDDSTVVGSQWGDFGNANGGLIGGIGSSGTYLIKNTVIECRIDATNDIVSAYQWYNYRNSGMIVGRVPQTIKNGEVQTVKNPDNVTCENVTVIYDDWANYTYCEFAGTGYPYVRVQAGVSVDAYSNVRYGHPTDANGNTVVDDNHVHNDGEAHHELIAFDQLFGGPAEHRYCYYGINVFDGVSVIYNNK